MNTNRELQGLVRTPEQRNQTSVQRCDGIAIGCFVLCPKPWPSPSLVWACWPLWTRN